MEAMVSGSEEFGKSDEIVIILSGIAVILSAAKNLLGLGAEILRCAQDDGAGRMARQDGRRGGTAAGRPPGIGWRNAHNDRLVAETSPLLDQLCPGGRHTVERYAQTI
jgi:hypothetical protein